MKQKNSAAQTVTGFNLQAIERPLTSVDVVIFTVLEARLQVLLVTRPLEPGEPFPGMWALPGGFVDIGRDMDLEGCALRKLRQKTGIETPYLEQVGSWGDNRRDPRSWSATHVYFALIPSPEHPLQNTNNSSTAWFPIEDQHTPVKLAFDHGKLLQAAIQRLRSKVEYTSLPAFLLPAEFTLGDLQRMYEIVLERSLEKSAFRTRVFAANLVEAVDKVRAGPNRPAQLYRLIRPQEIVYFPRTFSPRKEG